MPRPLMASGRSGPPWAALLHIDGPERCIWFPATVSSDLEKIREEVIGCRRCPRLVAWREQVAREKRAAFADEEYWGRPVPGFGDPGARLLVVGLAPAAHGANRTGRMFTGDRSGEWLFRALHEAGYANRPVSLRSDDGLTLTDCYLTAVVRCAPPANKPRPDERDECLRYLIAEMGALEKVEVMVALGAFAWDGILRAVRRMGGDVPRPKPRFSHLAETEVGGTRLIGSFHPSQQNTFTGKLTPSMLDDVFIRSREVIDRGAMT